MLQVFVEFQLVNIAGNFIALKIMNDVPLTIRHQAHIPFSEATQATECETIYRSVENRPMNVVVF